MAKAIPWLNETESAVWRGHLRVSALLALEINRDLGEDSGLSSSDYDVLTSLSDMPGGRSRMGELAERMFWSRSRLSHQVRRMQTRGLVQRESTDHNAELMLTRHGRAVLRQAAPLHVVSVRRHLIDLLEPDQLQALAGIYATLLDHLDPAAGT